jgi:hypothetical protein
MCGYDGGKMKLNSKRVSLMCLGTLCLFMVLAILVLPALSTPTSRTSTTAPRMQEYYISQNTTILDSQSGHANAGWVYPDCTLDVYINTDEHKWSIKWDNPGYVIVPLPGLWMAGSWSVRDGLGWHQEGGAKCSGELTFDYPNNSTWATTHVHWVFIGACPLGVYFICVDLTVNLFGSGGHTGRGLGGAVHCYLR